MYIDKMIDLKLEKIEGLRPDKTKRFIVPFKKDTNKLLKTNKSMKTTANVRGSSKF